MKKLSTFVGMALFGGFVVVGAGCFATDAIDNKLDCSDLCDRYADCYDSKYDTAACKSRCESHADNDEMFGDKVELCTDCLDQAKCSDGFTCQSQCSSVVP